ncbi:exo-alpha-sialidase [Fusobacterium perfoetens]|uniref:exo-alpha-sialidase n=1 Tax=Fusobacterium perfoetens TaxID=852 RepID=UPI000687E4D6|nr:exo-alpha-sialidase [Fusobacterium perfoetens]
MKKLTLLTLFCALATGVMAGDGWNEKMEIYKADKPGQNEGNYYRIPALTSTSQGTLIAVGDHRPNGWNDIGLQDGIGFAVKVSHDGGNTWSEEQLLIPDKEVNRPNGSHKLGISDPAIVHDPNSGNTFLFGYQNDKWIGDKTGDFDFIMYTSKDGGKTWDKGQSMKDLLPNGYKFMLQGPGSGMTYNGTIYMPVQAWHHDTDKPDKKTCTSGYIYSEDGGKTWKASGMLRPENYPEGEAGKPDVTSESNIFHHNGKIYLAAKAETGRENKKRVVYCTSDNGKTWERVEENFIPDDIAQCESNTLALDDQVYLVSYTKDKPQRRHGLFITTNTGKTIQIAEGKVDGYTSMTQDLDNLYILFEESGGMSLKRYDISSKEYANLNAQILDRGTNLVEVQDKLLSKQYISGVYTNQSESGTEAVVELNNFKLGAFYRNTKENSDDVYRTIPYNLKETTLVLSQDNAFMQGDNIFMGYQAGKIEYSNKSKNDLNSFVMGYTFNREMENNNTYTLALNGIYSNNKVKRNHEEGVGRTADFDSYSISMKNQLSKEISFTDMSNLKLTAGLNTTFFGHDEFEENGGIKTIDGGKWNNAKIEESQNISNEVYVKATLGQKVKLTDKSNVKFALDLGWKKELMNVDDWRDDFTVLDVEKEFSTPVKRHEGGVGTATVSATFDLVDKVEVGVGYSIETDGESTATGKITYKL